MGRIDQRWTHGLTRREALLGLAGLAGSSTLLAQTGRGSQAGASSGTSTPTFVYAGTYTGPKSKGIYLFRLRTDDVGGAQGTALVPVGVAAESASPSFFELDRTNRRLYAVNELSQFEGKPGGAVSAFSINPSTGMLTLLNQQPSMGSGPCHIVADNARRHVFVANYGSGSVAVLPIGADGKLGAASDFVQHTGSSVNPDRQKGPHAHCVTLDPANRFVFVCDLGLDKVMAYRFDPARGKLTAHTPPFASVKPGAGPRHMVFRPDGRFAYVINEMASTITVFAYNATTGVLTEVQTVSTLPQGFDGANTTAEIDVHPSGRWIYGSNRGHNSVALFNVDPAKGTLTFVEAQATGGAKPRHFGIDPAAKHMAIGNQDSDTILVCQIDGTNGRLKPSGVVASCPSPVCMKFLPPERG